MTRPSGATLKVVKTFQSHEDCALQLYLLRNAPPTAVLGPVVAESEISFAMPLAGGRTNEYGGIINALEALWRAPGIRECSRAQYHGYATSRMPGKSCYADFPALYGMLRQETQEFFETMLKERPVTQNNFVHGDCTVSNFVQTHEGPRAIDLSPRACPPEIEVDIAKLWLSATGFDLDSTDERRRLSEVLVEYENTHAVSQVLLEYYRATHLLRVMATEPPNDERRWTFYKESARDAF